MVTVGHFSTGGQKNLETKNFIFLQSKGVFFKAKFRIFKQKIFLRRLDSISGVKYHMYFSAYERVSTPA